MGANKLVSQIASKLNKPAAFLQCLPEARCSSFIRSRTCGCQGFGLKTAARLDTAGLAKIRHIAATPLEMLELLLGSQAAAVAPIRSRH